MALRTGGVKIKRPLVRNAVLLYAFSSQSAQISTTGLQTVTLFMAQGALNGYSMNLRPLYFHLI